VATADHEIQQRNIVPLPTSTPSVHTAWTRVQAASSGTDRQTKKQRDPKKSAKQSMSYDHCCTKSASDTAEQHNYMRVLLTKKTASNAHGY
jgi:hypothetical protein